MRQPQSDVRPSPLAGIWYPGSAATLRDTVQTYLRNTGSISVAGDVLGLLAPHAGLRYSGVVAGYAFNQIVDKQVDTVVVIGPLHRPLPGITGAVITTDHAAYQTPLGALPVDHALLDQINAAIPLSRCTCDPEHSIEIELPFLQVALPAGFTLIPLMLREQSTELARTLGLTLAGLLHNRRVLFVASSDLSHFYPQDVAVMLDQKMLAAVADMDANHVIELDERGDAFACGRAAIAATIHAVRQLGANRATQLYHATSGSATGEFDRVVGYGAASFFRMQ